MDQEAFQIPHTVIRGEVGENGIRIKIIGVGGAGNNAVDRLKLEDLSNVNLAVVNTDGQVLDSSPLEEKLMIGKRVTRGLSAGGEADVGRQAAEEDRDALCRLVDRIDLLFILAGLGGGTGSGAAPVLAELAAESGAVVIAFVTMPFTLEGARRHNQAVESLSALRSVCHAVIPLPNDMVLQQVDEEATVLEAYALADEWIKRGVRSIWSMLFRTGLMNVDFATLRKSLVNSGGKTLFGLGSGEGEDAVGKAIENLLLCPLLHTPEYSRRADCLIVNISGGPDLTMNKVNEIVTLVTEKFGSRDNTVIGAVIDETMHQRVRICVLGTTDVDARFSYRKKKPVHRPVVPEKGKPKEDDQPAEQVRVHTSKLDAKNRKNDRGQEEFSFAGHDEQRGFFENTERNLHDGEDLDIPTYLRRGIKIKL